MKISLAVCEYNPLHGGHLVHLGQMRENGTDAVAVIMSGNFTQRGDVAVCDKLTRARHAVLAGADVVFELPAVFATANAEIFAKGAVKLLGELAGKKTLYFGAECGEKEDFTEAAKLLSHESKEFKKSLKSQLKAGFSLAKARTNALAEMGKIPNSALLENPNCILGVEYTRAILEQKADIDICPVKRVGAGFNDKTMQKFPSAAAIRGAIAAGEKKKIKSAVPPYVYDDLPDTLPNADLLILYSLIINDKKFLSGISDCTEGLENRIKSCAKNCHSLSELKEKIATKRYTGTRISRILISSLLQIDEKFISKCMKSDLYLNVLALKSGREELLSNLRQNCKIPLITRKNDVKSLRGTALECFKTDVRANDIYNLVSGKNSNEFAMLKV